MNRFLPSGLGWHPDVPDFRDFFPEHSTVRDMLLRLPERERSADEPQSVDLRDFFSRASPDQARLNASPAYACAALVEYFEYRAHGHFVDPSALFLYQTSLRPTANGCSAGGSLRATLKTMIRLGMPPEDNWPNAMRQDDTQPIDPVLFSFSEFYRSISYIRVEGRAESGTHTMNVVKSFLWAGFPVAFGFSVPNSLTYDANIDYRPTFDSIRGGQAVLAVGYDDRHQINGATGALLIRSSWGTDWGHMGYGWLPYAFVEKRLALDFWTLLKPDWLESGEFYRPFRIESRVRPDEVLAK